MKLRKTLLVIGCVFLGVVGYKFVAKFNCIPVFHGKDNAKINRDLYWAAFYGNYRNVCTLIHEGADVNYNFRDDENKTPLYRAASHGDDRNLNSADKFALPNMEIMGTRLKVVELLIKRGANVKAITTQGLTALHVAATKEIAEMLIKNGAVVDAQSFTGDGPTPLFKAVTRHKSVAEELIKYGANVNQTTSSGDTPLLHATRAKNIGVVDLLIKRGADINWKDNDSGTALEFALQSNNNLIAQLLMEHGAVVSSKSELGLNEMHWAVMHNDLAMVGRILDKGGDVDPVSKDGRTPLMEAVINNNKDIAEFLIKHGANINFSSERNWHNRPILFFAKDKEMLALLLSHGANVKAVDSNGNDIFYFLQGRTDLIEMVKNSGS